MQNVEGPKRIDEVKVLEYTFLGPILKIAVEFLGKVNGALTYKDFLKVHHVVFSEFYPWAGQDKLQLGVGQFIEKGASSLHKSGSHPHQFQDVWARSTVLQRPLV